MTTAAPRLSLELHEPNLAQLPAYAAALERGWSPDNVRDVSKEQLEAIRADASAFIASLVGRGGTVRLPDGSDVPKLPMCARWMWDGECVGHISLRWQPGTDELPEYVLGHIGFAVVPWKRRRGYATQALALMLEQAREVGLSRVGWVKRRRRPNTLMKGALGLPPAFVGVDPRRLWTAGLTLPPHGL